MRLNLYLFSRGCGVVNLDIAKNNATHTHTHSTVSIKDSGILNFDDSHVSFGANPEWDLCLDVQKVTNVLSRQKTCNELTSILPGIKLWWLCFKENLHSFDSTAKSGQWFDSRLYSGPGNMAAAWWNFPFSFPS